MVTIRFTAITTNASITNFPSNLTPCTYDNRNIEVYGRDLSNSNKPVVGWFGRNGMAFDNILTPGHQYSVTVTYPVNIS